MLNALLSVGIQYILLASCALLLATAVIWRAEGAGLTSVFIFLLAICSQPSQVSVRIVFRVMAILLAGYALFGRQFAGLGYKEVYVGELALVIIITTALFHGEWRNLWRLSTVKVLILFIVWGCARTLPFLGIYGKNALRDAVVWGYSGFALALGSLLPVYASTDQIVSAYRRLIFPLLLCQAAIGVARVMGPGLALTENQTIERLLKPGDVSVHLAGIACFVLVELNRRGEEFGRAWLQEWSMWILWMMNFFLYASQNRGGLLSIIVSLMVIFVLWRKTVWLKIIGVFVTVVVVFNLCELEGDIGTARKVSPSQIIENVASIAGDNLPQNEGTRQWRLQ